MVPDEVVNISEIIFLVPEFASLPSMMPWFIKFVILVNSGSFTNFLFISDSVLPSSLNNQSSRRYRQ